ncbi:MAG: hypothetical protein KIT84_34405 [Labilithrix sp.]|nr:hypothetical protein [Labilithrix sp.]MCW5816140.1 hypothetical protein [Labilithrix sp.]
MFVAVAIVVAVGCSSKDDPAPADADAGASSTSSSSSTGGVSSDSGVACSANEDVESCQQCCVDQNPEAGTKLKALLVACLCKAEGCGEACKDTLCAGSDYADGSPCDECIRENSACPEQADVDCRNDATCKPGIDCLLVAACSDKPEL